MRHSQKIIAAVGLVALVAAIGLSLWLRIASREPQVEHAYFSCSTVRTSEHLLRFQHDAGSEHAARLPLVGALKYREESLPLAAEGDLELREVRLRFDEIAGLDPTRADALRRAAEVPVYVVYRNGGKVTAVYLDATLDVVDDAGMRALLPFIYAFQYDAVGASEYLFESSDAGNVEVESERVGARIRKKRLRFLASEAETDGRRIEASAHEFRLRDDGSLESARWREKQVISTASDQPITMTIKGEAQGNELRALDAKAHTSCAGSKIANVVAARGMRPMPAAEAASSAAPSLAAPITPTGLSDLLQRLAAVRGDEDLKHAELRQLIAFLAAHPDQIAELSQQLLAKPAGDEVAYLLLAALAAVRNPEQAAAMRELIITYRQHDHGALKIVLEAQEDARNVDLANLDLLWQVFDDRSVQAGARRAALLALGTALATTGDEDLRAEYRQLIHERLDAADTPPKDRAALVAALGNMGDAASARRLMAWSEGEDQTLAREAIYALRLIDTDPARRALAQHAGQTQDLWRHDQALIALKARPLDVEQAKALIASYEALPDSDRARKQTIVALLRWTDQAAPLRTIRSFFAELAQRESDG